MKAKRFAFIKGSNVKCREENRNNNEEEEEEEVNHNVPIPINQNDSIANRTITYMSSFTDTIMSEGNDDFIKKIDYENKLNEKYYDEEYGLQGFNIDDYCLDRLLLEIKNNEEYDIDTIKLLLEKKLSYFKEIIHTNIKKTDVICSELYNEKEYLRYENNRIINVRNIIRRKRDTQLKIIAFKVLQKTYLTMTHMKMIIHKRLKRSGYQLLHNNHLIIQFQDYHYNKRMHYNKRLLFNSLQLYTKIKSFDKKNLRRIDIKSSIIKIKNHMINKRKLFYIQKLLSNRLINKTIKELYHFAKKTILLKTIISKILIKQSLYYTFQSWTFHNQSYKLQSKLLLMKCRLLIHHNLLLKKKKDKCLYNSFMLPLMRFNIINKRLLQLSSLFIEKSNKRHTVKIIRQIFYYKRKRKDHKDLINHVIANTKKSAIYYFFRSIFKRNWMKNYSKISDELNVLNKKKESIITCANKSFYHYQTVKKEYDISLDRLKIIQKQNQELKENHSNIIHKRNEMQLNFNNLLLQNSSDISNFKETIKSNKKLLNTITNDNDEEISNNEQENEEEGNIIPNLSILKKQKPVIYNKKYLEQKKKELTKKLYQ